MPRFYVADSKLFMDGSIHPYAIAAEGDNVSFILIEEKNMLLKKVKNICKEASNMSGEYDKVWGWVVESVFNAAGYVAGDGFGSMIFMPLNENECPENMNEAMYEMLLFWKLRLPRGGYAINVQRQESS